MSYINDAIDSARGNGCPKCLVGKRGMMADPMFNCEVCNGTGIEHYRVLSATEALLAACKAVLECETRHDENGHAYLHVPARSMCDVSMAVFGAVREAEGR